MPAATASFGRLPFKEQISFFRRKLNLPTQAWTDIYGAEHDRAFVVAGAAKMDLLGDLRDAVDKAISQGTTLAEFRKDFDSIVERHGWVYNGGRNWRSRVIYETNLRTSYAAGRYEQMQAVKQYRPFWRYIHQDGEKHPRPQHEAWNGLILHADNPWWGAHYPPGGWGCKCSVETLAQRDLDRLGRSPDSAPPTDMRTVTIGKNGPSSRIVDTPAGIDPGFGHIQGKTSLGATAERFIEKSAGLPAPVAAQAVLDATSRQRVIDGLSGEFSSWLSQISKGENDYFAVGALSPDLVDSMAAHGHPPETAAIIVRDAEALHVMRDSKVKRLTASGLPKALTVDQFGDLPRLLANPRAVLLDKKRSSLLYVFDPPTRSAGKIVVAVNFRGKLSGAGKSTFNAVQTASLTEIKNLQNEVESGDVVILQGKL